MKIRNWVRWSFPRSVVPSRLGDGTMFAAATNSGPLVFVFFEFGNFLSVARVGSD